jgi:hypothetical protein
MNVVKMKPGFSAVRAAAPSPRHGIAWVEKHRSESRMWSELEKSIPPDFIQRTSSSRRSSARFPHVLQAASWSSS